MRPVAGAAMAVRSAVAMRGISRPYVLLVISSIAELSGLAPVVFIATCAWVAKHAKVKKSNELMLVLIEPFGFGGYIWPGRISSAGTY